jgi:hypothetical protein
MQRCVDDCLERGAPIAVSTRRTGSPLFSVSKLAAMRSHWIMILRYFLGSALIVVIALGLARALVVDDPGERAAKTLLDERIETARQIRRALETPVPPGALTGHNG